MTNQNQPNQSNPTPAQPGQQQQNAPALNDDQLAEHLAAALLNEHKAAGAQQAPGGPHANQLGDVFKRLRAAGIPWAKILAMVPAIVQLITTGTGDWNAIIAAVLALFGKTPTP